MGPAHPHILQTGRIICSQQTHIAEEIPGVLKQAHIVDVNVSRHFASMEGARRERSEPFLARR
jgi:hypothetical protein